MMLRILAKGLWGRFWSLYGDAAIDMVRTVRDTEIPRLPGEDEGDAWIRGMLDLDRDGVVTLRDFPDSWIIRLREIAYGIVEEMDGDVADGIASLIEALESGY